MTIGQTGMKHPSLAAMVAAIQACLSRVALHERFTAPAAAFMEKCLRFVVQQRISLASPIQCKLLRRFKRVLIVDSSSWDVDDKLRRILPGSGGNASGANCKLQAAYEYKKGDLTFVDVTAGNVPDNRYTDHLPHLLNKKDLVLIDQGYFKLETLKRIACKGAFFLTRFLIGTALTDLQTMAPIDLSQTLRKLKTNLCQMQVIMGGADAQKVSCRLICLRASGRVANQRRRRLRKQARKKGRTPSRRQLALCDWTLIVTNVPEQWLPPEMARALYTLRWQIELLFKQLKSVLRVHESDTSNEHRLRCELYGKLIMAVLIHRIHAFANVPLWNKLHKEISMDKLYKRIQERAFVLMGLLLCSLKEGANYLRKEIARLLNHCVKQQQPSRLTTLDMLEAGFDQQLEVAKMRC